MALVGLRKLCTPALVYLVLSIVAVGIMYLQNIANFDVYCLATFSCSVYNVHIIFLLKFVYILFWTWVLNLMCSSGADTLAWIFLLLPFILMFIIMLSFMMSKYTLYK